jgi:hypothetical protein
MSQRRPKINEEPSVRPTKVKSWLTAQTMSPLGKQLMKIAKAMDASDIEPMDEEAIEQELTRRRGGNSQNGS